MIEMTPTDYLYSFILRLRDKVASGRIKEIDACHLLMNLLRIWHPDGVSVKTMRELIGKGASMPDRSRYQFCASLLAGEVTESSTRTGS